MVVFPTLANDSQLLNENQDIKTIDQKSTIMSPGNDGIVLTIDQKDVEQSKLDLPTVDAEPAIVKKIAAGLKSGAANNNRNLIGSLSSGSSIVTICSDSDDQQTKDKNNEKQGSDGDDPENPSQKQKSRLIVDEEWYLTLLQISVPFFIAGIGTIGAGLVLANVKKWDVFKQVSQIFILIPALLGLKGNLDMCLASRLSTQANLGNMNCLREIMKMIIGNVALVQVQATVAATLVSIFATAVGAAMDGEYSWDHFLLVLTSSISTATSSCFILDFVMIAVIMSAHKLKMNPDNLATPLAASIGDVVSISVLSRIASHLYGYLANDIWIFYLILSMYAILLPMWIYIVLRNKYTKHVLTSGWTPVISALFISGLGGLILDQAINSLKGFDIFQPIVNGIGGNLVSVQASRISTMLHQSSLVGLLPPWTKTWVTPWSALFHGAPSAKTARLLIGMSIPGNLLFSLLADYIKQGTTTIHLYFTLSYLTVSIVQVMLLLYVAHIMIHVMWKYKIDPDNSAIPYLTALGDLSGSVLLAAALLFLKYINKEYVDSS